MDFARANQLINALRANLSIVIKGHEPSIDLLVVAIIARGHVLLDSVPGEGKTLLAKALAASIDGMTAGRISGQPTLKPSDLLGAEIITIDLSAQAATTTVVALARQEKSLLRSIVMISAQLLCECPMYLNAIYAV